MIFFNMTTGEQVEAQPWQRALLPGDCYVFEWLEPMTHIYCQVLSRALEVGEGFLWVMAYSERLPGGERGVNCIVDGTRPISKEEFEQARARGWKP